MQTSSRADVWDTIAREAAGESALWGLALRAPDERQHDPIFSPLGEERFALGVETIYEGYLLHYGRPRLFAPSDRDISLLLGDYLYAHGLVRISEVDPVDAVRELAELISLCAQVRAEAGGEDGLAWAATAALLGRGVLDAARDELRLRGDPEPLGALARAAVGNEAVAEALAAHARRVG